MNTTTILLWILFFVFTATEIEARVEFTNIKCEPLDKAFADFEYCYIKAVNRSYKYISVKVNLFKLPVTKIKANFCLMKRFNGYKPFLYNVTFDGCKYFENNTRNPIAQYLAGAFQPYINMNHCPLDENIVLDKLPIDYVNNHFTNVLPFPHGDYALFSKWLAYDINRADVKVFFTLS